MHQMVAAAVGAQARGRERQVPVCKGMTCMGRSKCSKS